MKIIENKLNNPYERNNLTLISKVPILHEGRSYYLQTYKKNYECQARLKRLVSIIFPTLLSFGLLLFKESYHRKWKIILFGKREKEILVPRKAFKVWESSLSIKGDHKLEDVPRETVTMQKKLDELQIPLNCHQPAQILQSNQLFQDAIEAFLDGINDSLDKAVMKKLFEGIDLITKEDLNKALSTCTRTLNERLKGQSYSIGFVPGKSQQWIAELALPQLENSPSTYFENATDAGMTKECGRQSSLDGNERNYVIFDDASYSGSQLETTITNFKCAYGNGGSKEKAHLYLVVPFISHEAEERLEKATAFAYENANVQVHLITTDKKIRAVTSVFKEKEMQDLREAIKRTLFDNSKYLSDIYIREIEKRCLSIMEWKIPDSQSIPEFIQYKYDYVLKDGQWQRTNKTSFMTNYPPPYKKAKIS